MLALLVPGVGMGGGGGDADVDVPCPYRPGRRDESRGSNPARVVDGHSYRTRTNSGSEHRARKDECR